jgi:hypothetical protein
LARNSKKSAKIFFSKNNFIFFNYFSQHLRRIALKALQMGFSVPGQACGREEEWMIRYFLYRL